MCAGVHISMTKWRIVKYDIDALWDLCSSSIVLEGTIMMRFESYIFDNSSRF